MYTDINGVSYKLEGDKAIIQQNNTSSKIEIFPTITVNDKVYEVMFPDDCSELFCFNIKLEKFILHKLLNPTSNIINMSCMFEYLSPLRELDLTNLNTENVTDMNYMFVVVLV